jgi:hypothetical protein
MSFKLSLLIYIACCFTAIFASCYGLYLLYKKVPEFAQFFLDLFSNDPKTPSTTKFISIISGLVGIFVMWGTWAYCQIIHVVSTIQTSDLVTLVEIPTGTWVAFGISLCPGAFTVARNIWGKTQPCPPPSTSTVEPEKKEGE